MGKCSTQRKVCDSRKSGLWKGTYLDEFLSCRIFGQVLKVKEHRAGHGHCSASFSSLALL
jgi:hypothetical protein